MKILRITESQYKRLVKTKRLNEGIIFNNPEDEKDLTPEITKFLDYLSDVLLSTTNKDLFIKNIENGIVYIDETMYDEEDEKIISEFIDFWVFETIFKNDKKIDSFTYDSGLDYDYEDVTDLFKCYCEDNETGETIEYICGEEIPENCKKDDDDSEIRQKIVDKAYTRLGEPYKWGCEFNEKGGDCSGLIDWTLRNVDGIDSPYKGRETSCVLRNLMTSGNKGRKNNLGKGDILIFYPRNKKWTCTEDNPGHVGFVYDTDGDKVDMIDAASGKGVRILKDVFNKRLGKNRYYGVIPIVDGKYESK